MRLRWVLVFERSRFKEIFECWQGFKEHLLVPGILTDRQEHRLKGSRGSTKFSRMGGFHPWITSSGTSKKARFKILQKERNCQAIPNNGLRRQPCGRPQISKWTTRPRENIKAAKLPSSPIYNSKHFDAYKGFWKAPWVPGVNLGRFRIRNLSGKLVGLLVLAILH